MKYFKDNPTLILLLLASVIVFFYSYWANTFRPGALIEGGWYGAWADQRRYYEQTQAIVNLNLNADSFHYPILYPLLGAFFIKFLPRDPFFLVNLGLFTATVGLLYLLVEKIFDRQKAIFAVTLLLSTQRFIYDFVTPWTTSVTTPLFLACLYVLFDRPRTIKRLTVFSSLVGLSLLARATDVVFFLPLLFAYGISFRKERLKYLSYSGLILVGFFVINFFTNKFLTGSFSGPYISRQITKFSFQTDPINIYEKIIGYFANSFVYHRQIEFFSLPILQTLPLFIVIIIFFPLLYQNLKRTKLYSHLWIGLSFLIFFGSHIIFEGFAPYTLKNLSAHYMKLWYPVAIFYSMYVIEGLSSKNLDKGIAKKIFIIGFTLLLVPIVLQKSQPRPLPKTGWATSSSVNSEQIVSIIDGDSNTAWSTLRPRQKKDEIIIDMKTEHLVNRLQLVDDPKSKVTDFDTFVSEDKKSWKKLAPNYTYYVRREYGLDVVGYMQKGRYIKLILSESSKSAPWTIQEITVFGY